MTEREISLHGAFFCLTICVLLVLIWALSACGSWQQKTAKTLNSVSILGKRARQVAEKVCEPTLQKCIAEKTNPCPPLVKCQAGRGKALKALHSLQTTILLGYIAIQSADKPKADQLLKATLQTWQLIEESVKLWTPQQ
jgi:hypothetical protein